MEQNPKKRCFKCEAWKPRTEFYRHPNPKDGLLGKCKECTKRDVAARKVNNRERYLAERRRIGVRRYRKPGEKVKALARAAVSNAIRDGKLMRPDSCSECRGEDEIQAHHDDYTKPLDVRWLCAECHRDWHRNNTAIIDKEAHGGT